MHKPKKTFSLNDHNVQTNWRPWRRKIDGRLLSIINGRLSYLLIETIEYPKSLETGNPPWSFPLSSDTFWVGTYDRPKFQLTTNERGDIIKSTVAGDFKCWYEEYTVAKAWEILSKYEKDKNFIMLVSEDGRSQRTVFNEKEWLEVDIGDLVEANKGDQYGKSYLTEEYGGPNPLPQRQREEE